MLAGMTVFHGLNRKDPLACKIRGGYYHCWGLSLPAALMVPNMASYLEWDRRPSCHLGVQWLCWITSNMKKAGISITGMDLYCQYRFVFQCYL